MHDVMGRQDMPSSGSQQGMSTGHARWHARKHMARQLHRETMHTNRTASYAVCATAAPCRTKDSHMSVTDVWLAKVLPGTCHFCKYHEH